MDLRRREFVAAGMVAVGGSALRFVPSVADAEGASAPDGFTEARQAAYVAGFTALAASEINILDPLDAPAALDMALGWYDDADESVQRQCDGVLDAVGAAGGTKPLAELPPDRALQAMLDRMAPSSETDSHNQISAFVGWLDITWPTGQRIL